MMPLMKRVLYALPVLVGFACGGGDGPLANTPEGAVLQLFDYINKGQWSREWDALHPVHQKRVPKEHFIECAERADVPDIDGIDILEVYDETIPLPGYTKEVDTTAVTVRLELSSGLFSKESEDTFHVVLVDGVWRWLMSDPNGYSGADCPSG